MVADCLKTSLSEAVIFISLKVGKIVYSWVGQVSDGIVEEHIH